VKIIPNSLPFLSGKGFTFLSLGNPWSSAFPSLVGFPRQLWLACTKTGADTEPRLHCSLLHHQLRYSCMGAPFFGRCLIIKIIMLCSIYIFLPPSLEQLCFFPPPWFCRDSQSQHLLKPIHHKTTPSLPSLDIFFGCNSRKTGSQGQRGWNLPLFSRGYLSR